MSITKKHRFKKIFPQTIAAFFISLSLCAVLIATIIQNKLEVENATMKKLIMEKSSSINTVITELLYKTNTLAAFVAHNEGKIDDFDDISATLVDNPSILNVLLAPNGIVTYVYPREGNEQVLGLNFFSEGNGNPEAIKAKETGELVFGGPFELVQGGMALVGRLPIYVNDEHGNKSFWGLASITLRYPDVLAGTTLDSLNLQGFTYEIWRISPDTGEKQIIAGNDDISDASTGYIENQITILNADWYFRIAPIRERRQYIDTIILILISLAMSALIGFIVQNNNSLKQVKDELEKMVVTDPLLGILNRKGLFQKLNLLLEQKSCFSLHYLDLNNFKTINDTYGHHVGDIVLMEFSRRISMHLDTNHLFARIGGDEFVLIQIHQNSSDNSDILSASVSLWNTLDSEFKIPTTTQDNLDIAIAYSRGTASYPIDGKTIDELIAIADKKMYLDKKKVNHSDI